MAGQQQCFECKTLTKYKCINCKVCVCNRPSCSVAEVDEETDGWVENINVANCNSCFLGYNKLMPLDRLEGDHEEEDEEVANILSSKNNKNGMKKSGRRSLWTSKHIDDMVDIIVNSENYKKNLIFMNNRRSTNTEIYNNVLKQIKERHPTFPLAVGQIRNKFKWCVGVCKKVALTVQTATGVKRFIEEKGYGKWFDALFPLIKSRDSCQPEQSVEPSTSNCSSSSNSSTPVGQTQENDDCDDDDVYTEKTEGCTTKRKSKGLFVPIKKRKKKNNESESVTKVLKILETMVENDPMKDLLQIMKDDAEKSRQMEMELLKMLCTNVQGYVPQMAPKENLGPQQQYLQSPTPQHWQPLGPPAVPQTPPSRNHSWHNQAGMSSLTI